MGYKYNEGDVVCIKTLSDLIDEFPNKSYPGRILVPYSWVTDMDRYAGGEYEVAHLVGTSDVPAYKLRGAGGWTFAECTLENIEIQCDAACNDPQIRYDDLF